MSFLPRREDGKLDYKNMWEFKLLKGIFLFFVYLCLLIYVLAGAQSAYTWGKIRYYSGHFTAEDAYRVTDKLRAEQGQLTFVRVLTAFPLTINDEIVTTIEPLTPHLNASYFFVTANRYEAAGNRDRALFWATVGQYRMRYDAIRCAHDNAVEFANQYADLFMHDDLRLALRQMDEDTRRNYLRQALAWDEANPPQNNPDYFCDFISSVTRRDVEAYRESDWEYARDLLRLMAIRFIDPERDDETLDREAEKIYNETLEGEF